MDLEVTPVDGVEIVVDATDTDHVHTGGNELAHRVGDVTGFDTGDP
jgi:hypothetical protein